MITFESRRRSPREGYRVSWGLFRLARRCQSSRKKRIAFDKQWQALLCGQVHYDHMKEPTIRNILVPIDFSKMSMQAINTAKRLASRFSSTIHLAHVRQFSYPVAFAAPMPPAIPFSVATYDHKAEEMATRELNAFAAKLGLSPATCHLLSGAPVFNEICRLAQKIPADLIVMPTHGRTGLKHVFLGSTAERIVQHSPCPVFVVREKKRPSKTRPQVTNSTVLVPVDFSGCAREGLRYAIGFANEFGAKIILLHATYLGYIYSSEGTALYDIPGLQKTARKTAERQMRELVRSVNFGGVKFETAFTEGSPVLDICAFTKDHNVDLIITSTHGLTGFKHVLIGSIAEQVVRHAACSVLVVPSHPKMRAAKLTRRVERASKTGSPVANKAAQKYLTERERLTRKYRKLGVHAFPERRKTNKFRESHLS
jgi:nucleotide-binding universal stress UspA family protein